MLTLLLVGGLRLHRDNHTIACMKSVHTADQTTRRTFLQLAAGVAVANSGILAVAKETVPATQPADRTVLDRLWIWGHEAGSYKLTFGLPRTSQMTPMEGAAYLGVPNLFFIRYEGRPPMPFDQHAIAFRQLRRVVWSLVGASGASSDDERKHVLELAARFPNIVGFIMDDFFKENGQGSLSVDELRTLRERLLVAGRRRELIVVWYRHQLALPVQSHLELCDKITFWTWRAEELNDLQASFERLEKLAPAQGKLLGCYLWDFGTEKPMPLELMKKQCELGLQWLRQKRIEGMIFLGSNVCDLELDTVQWTRSWIAEVGQQELA